MSAPWTRFVWNRTWTTWTASTKFYSKEGRLDSILFVAFLSLSYIFIYFPLCSFINLPFKTQITGRFLRGGACQVDELSKRLQSSKDMVTKFLWQKRPETTEGSPEMSEFKSIHVLVLNNVEACQQNVNMSKGSKKKQWAWFNHIQSAIKMSVDGQGDDHGQLFHEVLAYPGGLSRHNRWKYHEIRSLFFSQRCL